MGDRLYRHPTDRVIAGVAGGLAAWLSIDPSLVRVAWVLLAIFSGGLFVLVYVVMMVVVPLPPPGWVPRPRGSGPGPWNAAGPAPDAIPGWQAPGGSTWASPAAGPTTGPGTPPAGEPWNSRGAGLVIGVVLIGLGVWFLIDQYVSIDWDVLWPVAIMVAGGALIAGALIRRRPD